MPLGAFKAALMGTAGATAAGDVVLLSTQTASDSASLTFSSGITSTYGEYIFSFYNINCDEDEKHFGFQVNAVGASGYNETITSSSIKVRHTENDSTTELAYGADVMDLAQATTYQLISENTSYAADAHYSGTLHLFNPSSSTYVKHFQVRGVDEVDAQIKDLYVAGYINTTTAIDDINFKFTSGTFTGKIKMWGVK